jgi:hypothetical protein
MADRQNDNFPDLALGLRLSLLTSGKLLKGCFGKAKVILWRDGHEVHGMPSSRRPAR